MRQIRLSSTGGDRATAYCMSNKIVALPGEYCCTWIDSGGQNQWALVDVVAGRILHKGAIGQAGVDNHCGAALALLGTEVHAITGAHHGPFQHYRMSAINPGHWEAVANVDGSGTYPSVVADRAGRLHLAYRSRLTQWTLDYCRWENQQWSAPQTLVVAEKPGYIYWTNALAATPDDGIHLVFGNTRVDADEALFYGASHIASHDGGITWRDDTNTPLSPPATVSAIPLIPDAMTGDRVQSHSDQQAHRDPGPHHFHYQQMLLSNPVMTPDGVLHVVLHNGLTGTAYLMSYESKGSWTHRPLSVPTDPLGSRARIHMQSSLAVTPDGGLRAALMIAPTDDCVWGPPGTDIVLLEMDAKAATPRCIFMTPSPPDCARWLPAQPQGGPPPSGHALPLLYTQGRNAGGFSRNKNTTRTDVILALPD